MNVNFVYLGNSCNRHGLCSKNISFKAHPDFYKFSSSGYDITASSYFRRGNWYGAPSDEFVDVENCLKNIFDNKTGTKRNMLIAGIGKSQEPFSLLAVIKAITGDKLKDNLDLQIVDLQSKPESKNLLAQSYLGWFKPAFAESSFVKEKVMDNFGGGMVYRVNDEIFDFLAKTYENPQKAHWDTRIQDIIKRLPDESIDIVSINNTLVYIEKKSEFISTLKNIVRVLKKGGVCITDPFISAVDETLSNNLKEVSKGIFKKECVKPFINKFNLRSVVKSLI